MCNNQRKSHFCSFSGAQCRKEIFPVLGTCQGGGAPDTPSQHLGGGGGAPEPRPTTTTTNFNTEGLPICPRGSVPASSRLAQPQPQDGQADCQTGAEKHDADDGRGAGPGCNVSHWPWTWFRAFEGLAELFRKFHLSSCNKRLTPQSHSNPGLGNVERPFGACSLCQV